MEQSPVPARTQQTNMQQHLLPNERPAYATVVDPVVRSGLPDLRTLIGVFIVSNVYLILSPNSIICASP